MAGIEKNLVREFNRIFYEVEADSYDARHIEVIEGNKEWWDEVSRKYIKPLYNTNGVMVLDIGSGTGFVGEVVTGYLKKCDYFICYDLSMAMLKKSRQRLDKVSNCNIHYINGEVDFLPFSSYSIDVIIISALLHHLLDCSGLFLEIDRLLKKDGLIIMAHEPNKLYFSSPVRRLAGSIYKFLGGGKSITDQMQVEINKKLKEKGIINRDFSKEEILRMVEYQSPVEQAKIAVEKDKGFIPNEIINTYFHKYKVIELRQYSTYFIRPFFKKFSWLGLFVKNIASLLLSNGNLFSLILQK